jgi:hypothetical protein
MLNQEYFSLMMIENFGNTNLTIDVSSANDVFLNTQIPGDDKHDFKEYSKENLKMLMKTLKLRSFDIPHEKVKALTIPLTMTTLGLQKVKVSITTRLSNSALIAFFVNFYNIEVYKLDTYCYPSVYSGACEEFKTYRLVLSNDVNVFKPVIKRSCGAKSILSYQWFIDHYIEKFTYKTFPDEKSNFLRIEPYTFQFDDFVDKYIGFYTVKLIVREENIVQKKEGLNIWKVISYQSLRFHF